MRKHRLAQTIIAFLCACACAQADLAQLVESSGIKGGLIVHLGCDPGQQIADLHLNDRYLVQGLDVDIRNVGAAQQRLKSLGIYGKVTANTFSGKHLPYTDNLVNLLIASSPYRVSTDEIMRVLAPRGVAYLKQDGTWKEMRKAWPQTIDEWTHYLHGPDNNAVAQDTTVGPPRHMQWLGGPRWTRYHHSLNSISSVVSARGRLFTIVDEATSANMDVPGRWSLCARDAFSGVKLWQKEMTSWAWHRIRFRSGPPQVTRLLVASEDRVYAPLGLNAPISVLDAPTGETLQTYALTQGAEEIILVNDVLLVLKGTPVAEQALQHTAFKQVFKHPNRKILMAIDTRNGRTLWEWSDAIANPWPETLGSDGRQVYVQVGESVTCLDLMSGRHQWTFGQRPQSPAKLKLGFGRHTLVVAQDVVLCKLSGMLTAISAQDGKKLWDCKAGGGFHAPLDVFVIDGLVWQGLHVKDSVAPPPVDDFDKGRDLYTGQVKRENTVLVDIQTSGHHHRCYREKATDRFIMAGKRGIEMLDLQGDEHSRNNWVRGTCQYGILPANGLVYAPSHACGCYMESKLWGFWALAAQKPVIQQARYRIPDENRLRRGPAYGKVENEYSDAESWPQFRHDPLRSARAGTALPTKLPLKWHWDIKAQRGVRSSARLTQPVIAQGKVLVAAVDQHTIYALDEETGKLLWQYVAGGRVDSPPAIYQGMALFGCADGGVYCLRLRDGVLAWRFQAAQADLQTVALNQVESIWPVHGSVLLLNGVAYCCAGRSTWIDRGMDLYGLDPRTGRVVYRSHFESQHPGPLDGKGQARDEHKTRVSQNTTDYKTFLASDRSDAFSMAAGAIADVLVSDGKDVFLHHVRFNAQLEKQDKMSRHLFSTSNLLDGSENHRSHWVLGTGDFSRVPVAYSWVANAPTKRSPTIAVPCGLMMVYDDSAVWAIRRKGGRAQYELLQRANAPFSDDDPGLPDFRKLPPEQVDPAQWRANLQVRPRALLKSGDYLYIGGMPGARDKKDARAAFEGHRGGLISIASAQDGSKVAELRVAAPVVWDGMAAAHGRLFASTEGGTLTCWGGE